MSAVSLVCGKHRCGDSRKGSSRPLDAVKSLQFSSGEGIMNWFWMRRPVIEMFCYRVSGASGLGVFGSDIPSKSLTGFAKPPEIWSSRSRILDNQSDSLWPEGFLVVAAVSKSFIPHMSYKLTPCSRVPSVY